MTPANRIKAQDSPRWCDHCQTTGDHHTDRCAQTPYGPTRRGLVLIPQEEWTEAELRAMLDDAECEYGWWNIAKRVREEMERRGLDAPEHHGYRLRPRP